MRSPLHFSLVDVSNIDESTGQTVGALISISNAKGWYAMTELVKYEQSRDGISRPFFAYFFFRSFGSGVAASAARSTCSVSS